jgi:hypothetical protein
MSGQEPDAPEALAFKNKTFPSLHIKQTCVVVLKREFRSFSQQPAKALKEQPYGRKNSLFESRPP